MTNYSSLNFHVRYLLKLLNNVSQELLDAKIKTRLIIDES